MRSKLFKGLPLAMLLIAIPAAAQSVPYTIPVSGQLYLAPQAQAPSQYVIRLVTPEDDVVYEQKGELEVDGNGHFDIMLGQDGEELSPKFLGSHPELLVRLELDGEMMQGSLPLGSVPYAKLAQEAISAQTLGGKKAADFLPSDHKPKWDDIQDKPASSTTSFQSPLVKQGDQVGLTECSDQEFLLSQGGQWSCARLPDKANPILAGDGLLLANNQIGLQPCQEGETLSVVASRWSCAQSNVGTYLAGTGLELNQNKFSIASMGVVTNHIADQAISRTKLADGAVNGVKLADGTIEAKHLTNNAVLNSFIANSAVTGDKIALGTITGGKLANATILGSKIANATILGDHISSGAITSDKISGFSINGTHIAFNANIPANRILNTAVTLNEGTQTFANQTLHINTTTQRLGVKRINPDYELDVNGTVRATTFLTAERTVTLPIPAVTMAISPPKSITLKSAAFVEDETGVKVVTTNNFDTDHTVMSAPVELRTGDMITGFVCYHRANATGTPLKYTATLYQQSFTGAASAVMSLNINEAPGATTVRTTPPLMAIAHAMSPDSWYFVQLQVPATNTNGIIQGCKVEVKRSQL